MTQADTFDWLRAIVDRGRDLGGHELLDDYWESMSDDDA